MNSSSGTTWKTRFLRTSYYLYELVKSLIIYPGDPVNFRPLDASPGALERDVEYALSNAIFWISLLPEGKDFLKGRTVLEIGPGSNFGSPLIFACHGARAMVADRFITPWSADYHPKFYALLRERAKTRWPALDLTPLDTVLSRGQYPADIISLCCGSVEELTGVPDCSVDLVVSNAVLEHLYDLPSAFFHLARITKPGGLGIHQVDFRDHRDSSRPLEFLVFGEERYYGIQKITHVEFGNRCRPGEMWRLLEQAGFAVRDFRPDIFADEEYLAEFLVRLRQARKSPYRDFPAEDLRPLSGLWYVVRQAG
jgi:SAM-dependent methyltransferase